MFVINHILIMSSGHHKKEFEFYDITKVYYMSNTLNVEGRVDF